jgi:hypothetical protein
MLRRTQVFEKESSASILQNQMKKTTYGFRVISGNLSFWLLLLSSLSYLIYCFVEYFASCTPLDCEAYCCLFFRTTDLVNELLQNAQIS